VVDDELRMRVGGSSGKVLWRAPLQREKWNDFVLRVKWSSDPRVGFVELYHGGQRVLPQTKVATQYSGQRNYLKLGLYRDASIAQEGIVFHDGFTQATRLEDVLPPAVVAAPAPASGGQPTPDEAPSQQPAPVAQVPSDSEDPSLSAGGVIPGDPTLAGTLPPAACGASSTGGTPLLVATGLAVLALVGRRRKQAPAYARRSRLPPRRR
jgi:uncharacterized protein (TIGR03382 family)